MDEPEKPADVAKEQPPQDTEAPSDITEKPPTEPSKDTTDSGVTKEPEAPQPEPTEPSKPPAEQPEPPAEQPEPPTEPPTEPPKPVKPPKPPKPPIAVEEGEATPQQLQEIETKRYYTPQEVASELNYSVSWVIKLIKSNRISAIKPVGGRWRIPASEVDKLKKGGLPPLRREKPSEPPHVIRVEGKHAERVKKHETDAAEKEKKVDWPWNIFLE